MPVPDIASLYGALGKGPEGEAEIVGTEEAGSLPCLPGSTKGEVIASWPWRVLTGREQSSNGWDSAIT
jgi:hypothetical protein